MRGKQAVSELWADIVADPSPWKPPPHTHTLSVQCVLEDDGIAAALIQGLC